MKYIFLDIDGVFNAQRGEFYKGVASFYPQQVKNFNKLLEMHHDAKIIISSAWRYLIANGFMTARGFEELLMSHGIHSNYRVWGHTPDLSFGNRGSEIEEWLKLAEPPTSMVIIDDAPGKMSFAPYEHLLVRTNGMRGLSKEDVELAHKILSTPFQHSV